MSNPSWNQDQLFSSAKEDWGTPQSLFDALDKEFQFTLDAAAKPCNAKCSVYITPDEDSLSVDISWTERSDGGNVWLNPPYSRGMGPWLEKAYRESLNGIAVVVLTFARTDTVWWHQWAMKAAEIRLIPGRVVFQGAKAGAPAPSCVIVFDEARRFPRFVAQPLPRR